MVINETLAKGLKDRFFNEFPRDIDAYAEDMGKIRLDLRKKNQWLRAVREGLARSNRLSLGSYEGGSNTKPYFVLNVMAVMKDRPYNIWNEKCLCAGQIVSAFHSPVRVMPGFFNIGEHAVMRLYMRSPVQLDENMNIVPYAIIEQFKYLPLWAAFWVWLQQWLKQSGGHSPFSPIMPAPNGLFLSDLRSEHDRGTEIRTFINDFQMNAERKFVRDLMLNISDPLRHSPMFASPAAENRGDVANGVLSRMIVDLLAPHLDRIAKVIFPTEGGDVNVDHTRSVFVRAVKALVGDEKSSQQLFELFCRSSVDAQRKFLVQLNHSMRVAGEGRSITLPPCND